VNRKYIVVFKNPRDKTEIVHLARQVYPENVSSFHKTCLEVCKDPHSCLFLDFTQSIKSIEIKFKDISWGNYRVFAAVEG